MHHGDLHGHKLLFTVFSQCALSGTRRLMRFQSSSLRPLRHHRPDTHTYHGTQHPGHIDGVSPGTAVLVSVGYKLGIFVQDLETDVQYSRLKLQTDKQRRGREMHEELQGWSEGSWFDSLAPAVSVSKCP